MKRIFQYMTLPCLLALVACSDIAESERLVRVEKVEVNRNVLIEDFTGQTCINCPKATEKINQMKEVYDDHVVAVAIHSGSFALKAMKTDEGNEYWNTWFDSMTGQPIAKINRGEATNDYDNWAVEVAAAMSVPTDVELSATITYSERDSMINIVASTMGTPGKTVKIQAWVTENNIVARQDMPDGSHNRDYVHNHVFRAAVNGTWGEEFTYGQEASNFEWGIKARPAWKPLDMNAVVFVYDENGVCQVTEVEL